LPLNAVAPAERRMMNLEKDFCLLKAMRLAMSKAMFNLIVFEWFKTTYKRAMKQK
jgi:hypothetical protein